MFFSIIIPTYNPKEYLPTLLESITHNDCLDEIDVIVSDDLSTEPFDNVLKQFPQLHIQVIQNDKHYGFPMHGRQHGAEVAKSTWICFADQDDRFVDHAFDDLYKFMKDDPKVKNYLVSDFIEESKAAGEQTIQYRFKGWTHGKFYEKAFWDRMNVTYDDLQYCEDINLTMKIDCIATEEKIKAIEYEKPVYVWVRRKDSLASAEYFALSLPDYVKGTMGVAIRYLEKYKDDKHLRSEYGLKVICCMLHAFFYMQTENLWYRKKIQMETVNIIQDYFTRYKNVTNTTYDDLMYLVHGELMDMYQRIRTSDYNQIPFIEQITFKDWVYIFFE